MPIITEEELNEIQKKTKKDSQQTIETKIVAGQKVFVGEKGAYYTTHGEAFASLQQAKEREEFQKLGLNENGQTPEQVKRAAIRKVLIAKRVDLVKELTALDAEISNLVIKTAVKQVKKK